MMVGIYKGGTPISGLNLGSSGVKEVYVGSTKVWPAGDPERYRDGPPATDSADYEVNSAFGSTITQLPEGIRFATPAFANLFGSITSRIQVDPDGATLNTYTIRCEITTGDIVGALPQWAFNYSETERAKITLQPNAVNNYEWTSKRWTDQMWWNFSQTGSSGAGFIVHSVVYYVIRTS